MSLRSAIARNAAALQPDYVRREPAGARDAVFRFSVPVLRVRDVGTTVAWYRTHLGFVAEPFPAQAPHEFAIIERDGVQLLVRRTADTGHARDGHTGWDVYIWADGLDFERVLKSLAASEVVRPISPMGSSVAEIEVRDPDGYVLCIGGPASSAAPPSSLLPPPSTRTRRS